MVLDAGTGLDQGYWNRARSRILLVGNASRGYRTGWSGQYCRGSIYGVTTRIAGMSLTARRWVDGHCPNGSGDRQCSLQSSCNNSVVASAKLRRRPRIKPNSSLFWPPESRSTALPSFNSKDTRLRRYNEQFASARALPVVSVLVHLKRPCHNNRYNHICQERRMA